MDDKTSARQMIGSILFLIAGPILWAINLTVIYGAQSSLCAFRALPENVIAAIVVVTTLALMATAGAFIVWPQIVFRLLVGAAPPTDQWPFLNGTMRILAALSALAMLYFATASLTMPACAALR